MYKDSIKELSPRRPSRTLRTFQKLEIVPYEPCSTCHALVRNCHRFRARNFGLCSGQKLPQIRGDCAIPPPFFHLGGCHNFANVCHNFWGGFDRCGFTQRIPNEAISTRHALVRNCHNFGARNSGLFSSLSPDSLACLARAARRSCASASASSRRRFSRNALSCAKMSSL